MVNQDTLLGLCDLVIHWKYTAQKWPVKIWFICESGPLLSVDVLWFLGHLAALHRCKRSCFQEHQDYCRVSCWWAHQCCQGEIDNLIVESDDNLEHLLSTCPEHVLQINLWILSFFVELWLLLQSFFCLYCRVPPTLMPSRRKMSWREWPSLTANLHFV